MSGSVSLPMTVHVHDFGLSFKMTPTLYQSNTMLAIPYGENESCIFVCYNTLRFVDTEIVRGPVRLHIYHWSKICWGIAGKVTMDQWNDSRVKFRSASHDPHNQLPTAKIWSSIREHSIMHNFLIRWTETQSAYFTLFLNHKAWPEVMTDDVMNT